MKSSKFQFINPYLEEIRFKENSKFGTIDKDIEIENRYNINIRKSDKENEAKVELVLEIGKENENVPFFLHIKVSSDFKWEKLSKESVDRMLKYNAPALLLSYMRPIVANITNSSKFPVYNLPFVNFKD